MAKPIRILLADDHPVVRNGIKLMLESQKSFTPIISMVSNGQEAVDLFYDEDFDVILLDINMPVLDGIETLKQVRIIRPDARVIMFTMHNEHHYINAAIKNGALGYILKQSGIKELVKAVETVKDQEHFFSEDIRKIAESILKDLG